MSDEKNNPTEQPQAPAGEWLQGAKYDFAFRVMGAIEEVLLELLDAAAEMEQREAVDALHAFASMLRGRANTVEELAIFRIRGVVPDEDDWDRIQSEIEDPCEMVQFWLQHGAFRQ